MKPNFKQLEKEAAKLTTPLVRSYLKHVLSPLENAVILHKFQPFRYRFGSIFIYVSNRACNQIIFGILPKIRLINHLIEKDKKSKGIPFKLRETFDNPSIILSLHPILRNKLCRLELYSMFAIMQKGKAYLTAKKFSEANLQTLDALFAKYKCSHLFN